LIHYTLWGCYFFSVAFYYIMGIYIRLNMGK
jgi:hypothetical protein